MSLLARVEVKPFNAQVELSDANTRAYPQWQTGEEAVAALPQSVAVATRGDDRGNVVIEVWDDELQVEDPSLSEALYDGELVVTDDKVVVGNSVGNELHPVNVPTGRHRIRVYTSPTGALPGTVYFLLN
jgi:hypothetical protein